MKTCPQQKTRYKPSSQERGTYLPYLPFKGFQLRCNFDNFSWGERWSDLAQIFIFTDIALKFIVLQFCTLKLEKHTDEECILYFTFTMFSVLTMADLAQKFILSELVSWKSIQTKCAFCVLQCQYSLYVTIADLTAYYVFVENILQ